MQMTDYIDRQKLLKDIEQYHLSDGKFQHWVEIQPSADVHPVRHGHWETIEGWDGDELYRCSECGAEFVLIDGTPKDNDYWFCPHCGADMRGEQNG